MLRLVVACSVGAGVAAISAVVLGDYPLSGSVPWIASILIPAVVGLTMTALAGRAGRVLWAVTGPLAAGAIGWGVAIATGWGLDPVPSSAWAAIAIALVWPPALAWLRPEKRASAPSTR